MANSNLVSSLVRGMDIVKLVSKSNSGLRLNEIAKVMNLKAPTCHNLLRTLVDGGFLEKYNNYYYIGVEFTQIATHSSKNVFFSDVESELLKLYQKVRRGVVIFCLATPYGTEQIYRISFDRPGVIQHLDNELIHPYSSAAGLIGLAFASDDSVIIQQERWPFTEYGIHLWKTRSKLMNFLGDVCRNSFAISPFDQDVFIRISYPVFNDKNILYGVVGISIPVGEDILQDMEKIKLYLSTTALRISGLLV